MSTGGLHVPRWLASSTARSIGIVLGTAFLTFSGSQGVDLVGAAQREARANEVIQRTTDWQQAEIEKIIQAERDRELLKSLRVQVAYLTQMIMRCESYREPDVGESSAPVIEPQIQVPDHPDPNLIEIYPREMLARPVEIPKPDPGVAANGRP